MSGEELHKFECPSNVIEIEENGRKIIPTDNHIILTIADDCLFLSIKLSSQEKVENEILNVEKGRLFDVTGCKIQVGSIVKIKEEKKIPWYRKMLEKLKRA